MRITSKGQVTIPQTIRDRLGLLPETEVEWEIQGDAAVVRRMEGGGRRGRALVEHLTGRGTGRLSTDEIMSLMRGED
ncbi:MAG: AbrB/MazE/SpoVT family DNA-binding domain-containing protein [Gemmatimonadota bacterium]|nr:AbrB/MazE/SpoVT family DNA-binding domain-containing protein [Gemmatimonadota bacterium]